MPTVDVRPYAPRDAAAIARLSTTVQWPSLTDPAVVDQVCTAPGAVAYVAEHREGAAGSAGDREGEVEGEILGWAQAMGDGVLQAHLGFVAVHPDHRRRGIARLLVVATFQATRSKRMDLVAEEEAGPFYEAFAHKRMAGFRIYPGATD